MPNQSTSELGPFSSLRRLLRVDSPTLTVEQAKAREAIRAAAKGQITRIPAELMTRECLTWQDGQGRSLGHVAAKLGQLGELPKDVLTPGFLSMATAKEGWTVGHEVVQSGHIDQVPVELRTREFFGMATKKGWTVLHAAAERGAFNQVPLEAITSSDLYRPDSEGTTPLEILGEYGQAELQRRVKATPEVTGQPGSLHELWRDRAENGEPAMSI